MEYVAYLNGNLYVNSTATLRWIYVTGGKIYIDAGPTGVVTLHPSWQEPGKSSVQGDIVIISGTVN